MKLNDTIAAIATPRGAGGIAIIRISGESAEAIADKVVYPHSGKSVAELESHKLTLCKITKAERTDLILDEALVAVMRAPKSYTGESVVEINCHGGFLAADKILTELLRVGARLAEKGEFTRRAFINGKTDLTGAEAVMDILNSSSEAGLHNSAKLLTGALAEKIAGLRTRVMTLASHISAVADFPDEVDPLPEGELLTQFSALKSEISSLLSGFETGRIMRDGVRSVIVGKPNVGKSSILNALLRCERAIVTDVPGTTRDTIEEAISIGGIALKLIDTAGIRTASDEVEKIGIERSKENIYLADLCLFVIDSSAVLDDEDRQIAETLSGKRTILIINKTDKPSAISGIDIASDLKLTPEAVIYTSAPKGSEPCGIDRIEETISDMFKTGTLDPSSVYLANERQRDSLLRALASLNNAEQGLIDGMPFDLLFIDLEDTLFALGEVTGETVQEEIIDKVFENFCVGK